MCPVRPDEHEPASGGAADGVRNGTEEEEEEKHDEQRAADGEGGDATHDTTGDDDHEEAVTAKPLRDPSAPTAAERAAHEATHLPFRSWCAECVAGRRDNPPHRQVSHADNAVPEILMDYCFVRREAEAETSTILIMKDRLSRAIQAWVVERKGADIDVGDAAQRAVDGIHRFGCRGRLMIKTDNEPATRC